MDSMDGLQGDIESFAVPYNAFRADADLWARIVQAGLSDEIRLCFLSARSEFEGLVGVGQLLEAAGIKVVPIDDPDGRTRLVELGAGPENL